MTNFMADGTVVATARRAEAEANARGGRVSENVPSRWLGVDASWRQRRLFDWAYLMAELDRQGGAAGPSAAMIPYVQQRIREHQIPTDQPSA